MMETDTCTCTHTLHVKIPGKTKGSNQGNQSKKTVALSGFEPVISNMHVHIYNKSTACTVCTQGKTKGSSD